MPESVTLTIHRPKAFRHLTQEEWAEMVSQRVRAREADERQRREKAGITVLGRDGVLKQNPMASPKTAKPRFQMNPNLAAKSKWPRIEALLRNRAFLTKSKDAIERQLQRGLPLRDLLETQVREGSL